MPSSRVQRREMEAKVLGAPDSPGGLRPLLLRVHRVLLSDAAVSPLI